MKRMIVQIRQFTKEGTEWTSVASGPATDVSLTLAGPVIDTRAVAFAMMASSSSSLTLATTDASWQRVLSEITTVILRSEAQGTEQGRTDVISL